MMGAFFIPALLQFLNRISIIVMASIMLSYNSQVEDTNQRNISKLESQTGSDCSDEFSNINISAAMIQMEEAQSLITSSSIYIGVMIAWIIFECCCGCCCLYLQKSGATCSKCNFERGCDFEICLNEFRSFMRAYKETN